MPTHRRSQRRTGSGTLLLFILVAMIAPTLAGAIEPGDLNVYESGQTLFIDANGAEIHIDYRGAPLEMPLKINISAVDPRLIVKPGHCTFTSSYGSCRQILTLSDPQQKVFGLQDFIFTESNDAAAVSINRKKLRGQGVQLAAATPSVVVTMGVQNRNMPKPIRALLGNESLIGKIVIKNGTSQDRSYQAGLFYWKNKDNNQRAISKTIPLPRGNSCYLDVNMGPAPAGNGYELVYDNKQAYVVDISNIKDPIYNGFRYASFDQDAVSKTGITLCSVLEETWCASKKAGAWTVGLANVGTVEYGVPAGKIVMLQEALRKGEDYIGLTKEEARANPDLALLLLEGSLDGAPFNSLAPPVAFSILEIRTTPPCSEFLP